MKPEVQAGPEQALEAVIGSWDFILREEGSLAGIGVAERHDSWMTFLRNVDPMISAQPKS